MLQGLSIEKSMPRGEPDALESDSDESTNNIPSSPALSVSGNVSDSPTSTNTTQRGQASRNASPSPRNPVEAVTEAVKALSEGSLAYLMMSEPIKPHTLKLQHHTSQPIAIMETPPDILIIQPKTHNEEVLLTALKESSRREGLL